MTTTEALTMPSPIIRYFEYGHLPPHLQKVSGPIAELANAFDAALPDGAEKSAGLRKLLEAKDCFVRAALPAPKPAASTDTNPNHNHPNTLIGTRHG